MVNLVESLKELMPDLVGLKESTIDLDGSIVGYESTFFTADAKAIAGGTSSDRDTARRIAVAEAFERAFYRKLTTDQSLKYEFKLDQIDSTLGFACGFEREKTAFRSFCEAIEKWAISKVIDDGFGLQKIDPKSLSPLALRLIKDFKETLFFKRTIHAAFPLDKSKLRLDFILFIGCSEDGAFPGSVVVSEFDDHYTHAVVEAWRSYSNFKSSSLRNNSIISQRVAYFGRNKETALSQIRCDSRLWPQPEIDLFREYQTELEGVFLFRSLIKGFMPVSDGPIHRFVI